MSHRPIIVLTGGPGGGKSHLIEELRSDKLWVGRFEALPEAVQYCRFGSVSANVKLFQRIAVNLQIGLEDGLDRALGVEDNRVILCHRGSLDPLAFWLQRGWPESEFFEFVGMSPEEHYRRYRGVIHLVTAADGVPWEYTRWPEAHRPEEPEQALRLDNWLSQAWGNHPGYHRIANEGRNWMSKSKSARQVLESLIEQRR